MKKYSIILIVLFCINTLGSNAQGIYFDSLYHLNSTMSATCQIFLNETGYECVGLKGGIGNSKKLNFFQIDSVGNLIQNLEWTWDTPSPMYYWYGEGFIKLNDGNYLWSNSFSGNRNSIIKFTPELDTLFTVTLVADSNLQRHPYLMLERENDYIGACMLRTNEEWTAFADLEIIRLSHSGEILGIDTIQMFGGQYQLSLSGIFELSDGSIIISGSRLYDWDPFIAKFTSEGELDSVYVWGNVNEQDWLPFLEPVGIDTFMVSYALTEEYYLNTYYKRRPSLMMFNAIDMSSIWEASYDELITHYYHYSIDKTFDNGYVTCGTYIHSSGQLGVIQRWSDLGEVLWTKTYKYSGAIADSFDDLSEFRDIKETADSGLVVCGYYADGTDGIQHAWVLKLDACGDPIYPSLAPILYTT
jgi:hypothetical protein